MSSSDTARSPVTRDPACDHIDPIIDSECFAAFLKERSTAHAVKTLAIFVRELEDKAVLLERIIPGRDAQALEMIAHSAIGSGSICGAARLVGLSRLIGLNSRQGKPVDWGVAGDLAMTVKQTANAINDARRRIDAQ